MSELATVPESLLYRDEYSGEVFDFLEALVNTCGANFTMDEDKEEELEGIRDTLISNNCALSEMIALKPEHAESYKRQHALARREIVARILRMRLSEVYASASEVPPQ